VPAHGVSDGSEIAAAGMKDAVEEVADRISDRMYRSSAEQFDYGSKVNAGTAIMLFKKVVIVEFDVLRFAYEPGSFQSLGHSRFPRHVIVGIVV
jgi:hypothetical protein